MFNATGISYHISLTSLPTKITMKGVNCEIFFLVNLLTNLKNEKSTSSV